MIMIVMHIENPDANVEYNFASNIFTETYEGLMRVRENDGVINFKYDSLLC